MEILYDTMPTQDEVRHFMDSEIERIELEKIAKEEMEEDQRIFDAMDTVLAVKSSGKAFTADDICVIRDFNRSLNISGPEAFSVERTLSRFIKERDSAATSRGWDGVTRDSSGRPEIDTNLEPVQRSEIEDQISELRKRNWPLEANPDLRVKLLKQQDELRAELEKLDSEGKPVEIVQEYDDRIPSLQEPWLEGLTESEADQKRQDMEDGIGVKYNQGKLRHAQLIPALWIRRLTEVLEYGCSKKYTMHNWKGVPAEDFLDSGFRHLLDVIEGFQENGNALVRDSESQLYNIYQAAWNLLAAAYNLENQSEEPSEDISLIPAWELEKLLDRRLKDDDETTIYASDIYNLISNYTKKV